MRIFVFNAPVSEDAPLPPLQDGVMKDTVLALRSLEDQLRATCALRPLPANNYQYAISRPAAIAATHETRETLPTTAR